MSGDNSQRVGLGQKGSEGVLENWLVGVFG